MSQLKEVKVLIDGIETTVLAQTIGQKFWCNVNSKTYCFDISEVSGGTQGRKNKAQVKTPHLILAPMPGKITKIFIDSGSQVQKSQALLVMEAMKMEYTLKSDLNTVVEKVNVQVGDQVTLGSLLIELKPEVVV
ncbi:MAG: hypothetical protein A2622_06490 [Bdellovibrionales bacterium RIFCSPHIGHO2_01_FULL_40_29]|nr:MAG: hypothetical protein A2622_06490 [Bdellovibrionales bacterium RIFCSPHIGHO2_01_FULL_40_29]OFZ35091.1 MAG: hypothetical protein A3D17_06840 [Bdellovibrionales bacterium RIFCSPHIGHO2_02_FULL_40_15]